jgi:sporulation protein YlmC with PRC-barrel domain
MINKTYTLAAAALACGLAASPALAAYGDRYTTTGADWAATRGANPDFAAASVDNLKGMSVKDRSGMDIGMVRDVMFDPSSGKIDHLIVSSFDAGVEKRYAVPFESVRFDRSHNLATLNMDRDQFYGAGPAMESRPLVSFTADELRGMHVIDSRGSDLGVVRDVTLNDGRIDRVIVGSEPVPRVFAIPVDRLEYYQDRKLFATTVTRDQLFASEYYGVAPIATMERRPLTAFTAEELKRMHVLDSRGVELGTVRDVTLDTPSGKVDRLIVMPVPVSGVPQHAFDVPMNRVVYEPDQRVFAVDMTRDKLYASEYYGVAPEYSLGSDNTWGATLENKTGQPSQRWELGSSPEGRSY